MTTEALGSHTGTASPWIPTDETFAARLALVRWKKGWNIKEAAQACGVPAASWRTWEIDGVVPRRHVEVSAIIAGRTGCDRMWLLLGPEGVRRLYAEATKVPQPPARKSRSAGRPSPERPSPGRPPRPRIHKLPVAA